MLHLFVKLMQNHQLVLPAVIDNPRINTFITYHPPMQQMNCPDNNSPSLDDGNIYK